MKNRYVAYLAAFILLCSNAFSKDIVTYYEGFKSDILLKEAKYFEPTKEDLKYAAKIAKRLKKELAPRMPVSGLSAPQIGISKQIFIYSWSKRLKDIEVVINPSIVNYSIAESVAWEKNLSSISKEGMSQIAAIKRPVEIEVIYMDLKGRPQHQILKGYGARAFQHHYDILNGKNHIKDKKNQVKTFYSFVEMESFLTSKSSTTKFIPPKNVTR